MLSSKKKKCVGNQLLNIVPRDGSNGEVAKPRGWGFCPHKRTTLVGLEDMNPSLVHVFSLSSVD